MSSMKSRAFSILFMFIISALFAGVVSAIKVVTADKVEDNLKIAASRDLVKVFELIPDEEIEKATGAKLADLLTANVQKFWVVDNGGKKQLVDSDPEKPTAQPVWAQVDDKGAPLAYAFPVGGKGFWGPVYGILAVEPDGTTIKTVVWTKHGETPGLGARIEEKQYREKFRGKLATPMLKIVPDGTMGNDLNKVDQITGATQTTVAGLGSFLPRNFRDWHDIYPLVSQRFASAKPGQPVAVSTEDENALIKDGPETPIDKGGVSGN